MSIFDTINIEYDSTDFTERVNASIYDPSEVKAPRDESKPQKKENKPVSRRWLNIDKLKAVAPYNKTYQRNIESLSRKFCGWRKIRGDGNCYYRSVIVSYILKIFHYYQNDNRIFQLIRIISNLQPLNDPEYDEAQNYIYNFLKENYLSQEDQNITQKICRFKMINDALRNPEFDLKLIRVARLIAYQTFKNGCDEVTPYLLEEEIEPISQKILQLGQEAEGIELKLLPIGLGIIVDQISIFDAILANEYKSDADIPERVTISIISKIGGHYDILYKIEDLENEEYNFSEMDYWYNPNFRY